MIKIIRDVMLIACGAVSSWCVKAIQCTDRVGKQERQSDAEPIAESAEGKLADQLDGLADERQVVERSHGAGGLSGLEYVAWRSGILTM
jgi:hypothetical protein